MPKQPPTDRALLDFPKRRLATWSPTRARRLLDELPDLYRNHLAVAVCLDRWADNLDGPLRSEFQRGFQRALQDIAAHFRQGDYVPEGKSYRQVWGSTNTRPR